MEWAAIHKSLAATKAQFDVMLERVSGDAGVLEKSLVAARHNGHGSAKADTLIVKGAQKRRFLRRG